MVKLYYICTFDHSRYLHDAEHNPAKYQQDLSGMQNARSLSAANYSYRCCIIGLPKISTRSLPSLNQSRHCVKFVVTGESLRAFGHFTFRLNDTWINTRTLKRSTDASLLVVKQALRIAYMASITIAPDLLRTLAKNEEQASASEDYCFGLKKPLLKAKIVRDR